MKKNTKANSTKKTTVGKKSDYSFIAGMPNSGPTGPNYQGIDTMKKGGSTKHPGFKKVQSSIAKKQGISKEAAGAILASSTRKASPAAKKANPRLKRVK